MYRFAENVATRLAVRQILLLKGPMGAGKTQFAKFLVSILGSEDAVSPSFAIHNQYVTRTGSVEHVDLFRLESDDELEATGFWDLFASPKGCIVVEWAERLKAEELPLTWACLELTFSIPESSLATQTRLVHERIIR